MYLRMKLSPPRRMAHVLTAAFSALLVVVLVFCFLMINGSVSPSESAQIPGIMTSKEVKPGMTGYGLTVFKGTRVEKFPVVVMGKLNTYIGESDLILVRVLGGYPVEHGTGIIAGMSGSPVYINGKLIGAIGYGWGFSKEPVGGVTPIENMLRELPGKKKTQVSTKKVSEREFFLDKPLAIDGSTYRHVVVSESYTPQKPKASDGTMVLTPVPSMIQVSGFSPATIKFMKQKMEPYGIMPLAVPAGQRRNEPIPQIGPGSAIGVTMIDGDLFMGGAGTVTWRSGDKILAFGHPMMQLGSTDLPLHAAYIEGIMPSLNRPFKFSSSLGIVGTMQQDRMYAIGGTLGLKPHMIPVTITVNDVERDRSRKFNLRVLDHKYLTPWFLTMAGVESMTSTATTMNDATAMVHYSIELKDNEKLEFDDCVAGSEIQNDAGMQLLSYLGELATKEFDSPKVERIAINIKMLPYNNTAYIKDISTQYKRVRPGDRMEVDIRLKTPDGKTAVKTVTVPIPSDCKKGTVKVAVASGKMIDLMRKKLYLFTDKPENVKQVIDRLRKRERNNELVVQAIYPRKTVVFAGDRLNNLPTSKQSIFTSSPRNMAVESLDSYVTKVKYPYNIDGYGIIDVQISGEVPAAADCYDNKQPNGTPKKPTTPVDASTMGENPIITGSPVVAESTGSMLDAMRSGHRDLLKMQDLPIITIGPPKTDDSKTSSTPKTMSTGSYISSLASAQDYFQGKFMGTSISNGNITLGHKMKPLYESSQTFIMDLDYDAVSKKAYAIEAPSGNLLELSTGAPPTIIGKTGETLPTSIVRDTAGNIYVGTGTNGRIYKKSPGTKMKLFATLPDEFVWDMVPEPSGCLLVGTGNEGKVYRIDTAGKAKMIFDPPEFHVMSLEPTPGGDLFIGCANEGTVYKMTPDGKVSSFYRTMGQSIEEMLYDNGTLWVASDELLYQLGSDTKSQQKVFIFPEAAVISLNKDSQGRILAGTSDLGRIYRLDGEKYENLYETDINQVMGIEVAPTGETILATGNPGKVMSLDSEYVTEGQYLTRVLDTNKMTNFGRLQWNADTPEGTSVALQTRSGNTPVPDNTWSDWSIPCTLKEGQDISSPPARYIQVRAQLTSTSPDKTPTLFGIDVYYRHQATAPLLEFDSPKGGEKLSGSVDVKWKAFSTSPQTLSYSLYSSADGGKTWKPISENVDAGVKSSGDSRGGDEMLKETKKWSTKSLKDGVYLLKIKGFDRTDAGNSYLTREIISKPIMVCNKKPEVTITDSVIESERAMINGFVKTGSVNVKEVVYQLNNDKEWKLAFPRDGIFDDTREKFIIYLNKPYPSKVDLKVKATDEAGNFFETTKKMTLKSGASKDAKDDKESVKDKQDNDDDKEAKKDSGKDGQDNKDDKDDSKADGEDDK